jgi:hypothetical protein
MDNPIRQKELLKNLQAVLDELSIQSKCGELLVDIVNLRISLKKFMYFLSDAEIDFMHNTIERNVKLIDKINRVLVKGYKPD